MNKQFMAFVWLRLFGLLITLSSLIIVMILADSQKLSYFSLFLFERQEFIKSVATLGIFIGVFFLFYTSSKVPDRHLNIKLFQGSMKMHPELIRQTLENWFKEQKIHDIKLLSVTINHENKIGLELKASNLESALVSLEDIESRLKEFMTHSLGINDPVDVQLFEI